MSDPNRRISQLRVTLKHLFSHGPELAVGVVVYLLVGMLLYHGAEGLGWSDSFLNAAMLLGGMGPINAIHTEAGKILIGLYALVAGLGVLVAVGVMLKPVIQHAFSSAPRKVS